jgi:hypothetical protein
VNIVVTKTIQVKCNGRFSLAAPGYRVKERENMYKRSVRWCLLTTVSSARSGLSTKPPWQSDDLVCFVFTLCLETDTRKECNLLYLQSRRISRARQRRYRPKDSTFQNHLSENLSLVDILVNLLDLEEGGRIFLRNVSWFSKDYTALCPRAQYSS